MNCILGKRRPFLILAAVIALVLGSTSAFASEPVNLIPRTADQIPVISGAYEDEAEAKKLLSSYIPEHNVIGKLRNKTIKVLFVDMVVDDVTRWYEKALGYPSVTLEELSVGEGIGPGGESPMYYWYEYYMFPDTNAYDEQGKLTWPGEFITKSLAESRRTWMRGAILQTANYGWFFKDMESSVTDCMLVITDAGFDFQNMTYSKRTAIILSWETYEPFTEDDYVDPDEDPEMAAYMKDVEEFAQMLLDDPPTPKMLDLPINDAMLFDPFTTAMYMMEGDPMFAFFWDIEPEEAVKLYSAELMLKPEEYEGGWVFVFSGRLPYPMHALYIYPNDIPGVPFKTLIFIRKEVVTR